uniref:Uncharacterized protein n=1 Tax=Candidatus Kentrum sp. SD TaxID=2126332 RepID=A0A451BIZ9_9GAMM|nr:MAG: hypothetical protein BECKSD772D_GA0070982_101019 [Candidatus Kentron sp. SD]
MAISISIVRIFIKFIFPIHVRIMDNCLKRLRAFAEDNPAYQHAIRNIRRDLRAGDNPHGNIGPARARALADACADTTLPLPDVIAEYQTIKRPDLAEPIPRPDAPLRRVMSLTCFVTYHYSKQRYVREASSDTESSLDKFVNKLKRDLEPLLEQNKSKEYKLNDFHGSTGKPEQPTWWSFREDGNRTTTNNGKRYLRELALSELEIKKAMKDGMAIEVIVPEEIIRKPLYKPCALDSFKEETLFRPDLSDASFGRTVPFNPNLVGHPELISESFPYKEMGAGGIKEEDIRLTVRPISITKTDIDHSGNTP